MPQEPQKRQETPQAVKELLIGCCQEPMMSILKIIGTNDTDRRKLQAIALYCGTVLSEVNKAVHEN